MRHPSTNFLSKGRNIITERIPSTYELESISFLCIDYCINFVWQNQTTTVIFNSEYLISFFIWHVGVGIGSKLIDNVKAVSEMYSNLLFENDIFNLKSTSFNLQ